ncbi:hypothetical protein ACQUW5_15150 [Legionella sp. CNM-1927-20]|uniref:hypothetical protein n=1 Tax=Legionella sp. CNM-1927-20 TaxID=3422221 RepID=UPI00403ABEAC
MISKQKISREIYLLKLEEEKLNKEAEEISKLRAEIINFYKENSNADDTRFELLRRKEIEHSIKKNQIIHKLRSLMLLKTVLKQIKENKSPKFERIVIGGGVASTMLYAEFPEEFRKHVLVINDLANPNTWLKEGHRIMGQPSGIQTPQVFSSHSDDFVLNHEMKRNPYQYVIASDFQKSLVETQNDLDMAVLNAKMLKFEDKKSCSSETLYSWQHIDYQYRVSVQIEDEVLYFYTASIDLCIGLGAPNTFTHAQIKPELERKLISNGKLVYAQDGEYELHGEVVFIGSSAINAAWIAEIVYGSQPQATIKYWVAVDGQGFNNVKALNRLIDTATSQVNLALGRVTQIEELSNGRLQLTFDAPDNHIGNHLDLTGKKIICDQVVYSSGQKPHSLTTGLSNFERCIYEGDKSSQIPLGTHSKKEDGSIFVWGAAGTLGIGLDTAKEREEWNKLALKHAKENLPHETKAPGGIYRSSWTIKNMVKQLQQKSMFPKPAPINKEEMASEKRAVNQVRFDAHKYSIPDINQAPLDELITVLSGAVEDKSECNKFALLIIRLRSARKSSITFDLPGIHDIKQLEGILPALALLAIQQKYFPFTPLPVEKKAVLKSEDYERIASGNMRYRPLSWLNQRKIGDSFSFVSNVSIVNSDPEQEIVDPLNITVK